MLAQLDAPDAAPIKGESNMHVVLGALGTLVTILWLLYRLAEMGIDLGGLNPFLWQRRRRWKQQHDANPGYKIDTPLEATALLMTAVAKADGDMSAEEKTELLTVFRRVSHVGEADCGFADLEHLPAR